MTFEFGVFHEFQRRPGQSEAEAFTTAFDQVDAAEHWGLDAIWLAEIHMAPERSVCSVPMTIASAIAARTKNIKIGTGVQVLPLCQPLRVAEDSATVDHISHGRLIFGVGRSGFPRAYEAYGIPYGESKERFAEVLEVLKRSWADGHFSFDGQFYKYHNVAMVPKPLQKPHPALRIAASSADTFPTNGAMGLPVFVAVRLGTLEELGPDIKAYREAYRAADHPGNGQVYLRVPIYVGEDEKSARAEPEQSIMQFYRTLAVQVQDSATRPGARASERRAERGQALGAVTYEEALRGKVIIGTPDSVTARLKELIEVIGLDGVLAELNCGGMIPDEKVNRSLRLMCQEVAPRFR